MSTRLSHVGKYEIEDKIGHGGFAVVYKARDPLLNRAVAIKILHANLSEDPEIVQRFYREAQSIAALRHPHIVTIYEIGELDDEQVYLAMEYLPGSSLDNILQREKTFSPEQTLVVLEQIGDALDYAHSQGLIHRDVKPQNVMVEKRADGTLHCVLADFGLAKLLTGNDSVFSGVVGTCGYMAPEQIAGQQDRIGPATDIYALGVMAYQMLTGRMPFEGDSASVLVAHLQDSPPNPSAICDTVSPEMAAILLKALAKNPADRYASAREMVMALRQAVSLAELAGLACAPDSFTGTAESLKASGLELPDMILIPAGAFWAGSDKGDPEAAANEMPRHRRELPDYYIARYPVTNAQYKVFVQATGYPAPSHWSDGQIPPGKENHPVVHVNYQEVSDYCRWLSDITARHYRLPTEYEWEKAARGADPETRRYPWGNEWKKGFCNSAEENIGDTTPVDFYEVHNCSPYHVADMVGNVWEWTSSLYKPYPGSSYFSVSYGNAYVVRGGSWRNSREDARIAVRGRYPADVRRPYLGFRVVREIK